ncbi:hypothetical protein CH354_07140 [Leptospira levettii]|uniref:hypothetical protein n=1 Tax=Leptospira levettii TaxID=2023178 RepID=UPI000C2AAE64|nr:hypothetical protein [Leptospira levettii]PJZ38946.1 hypothetical protein CH354_07140 [Leptospira levettii]PKA02246.1 hypothetical protein CH369_03565 [Leptospira levettii]
MNRFKILFVFLFAFVLFTFPISSESEKWKTCLRTHCISFQLPSNWYLTNRKSNGSSTKFDHFRTSPLKEVSGREIIPAIVVLFKESEKQQYLDPILFHLESKRYILVSNVKEYYNLQKLTEIKDKEVYQFLGMFGSFKDKEDTIVQHYITSTSEEFGFVIIVTCFESVYPQIEKDIKIFLNSLVYGKRVSPWNFVTVSEQLQKAKQLESNADTRLKTKKIEEISIALGELDDACELGSITACELFSNLMNVGR